MNEAIKQKIIELNNSFGIKTVFFEDSSDICGYSYDDTIYLNSKEDANLFKINKHELLHFFEDTEIFKNLKEKIISTIDKEKLSQIRSGYYLRYFGLYSENQIDDGILDTEIVIDFLIDNSIIEFENGIKIGDTILDIIKENIKEKRYLNLSVNANIKSLNLSEWEKVFVANYYDGKERKFPQGKEKISLIRDNIAKYLQCLYELSLEDFEIYKDSPEIIKEYNNEVEATKRRGEDASGLEEKKEEKLEELAKMHTNSLFAGYKHIVQTLKPLCYDDAFKCLILRETLTQTYKIDLDKKTGKRNTIRKKRNIHQSIDEHMVLNEKILERLYEYLNNPDKKDDKFSDLYFNAIEEYNQSVLDDSKIKYDRLETYGKGSWLKFESAITDPDGYLTSAEKLVALVSETVWCTKTLASTQLMYGDYYVFVDNQGKPHIAVKMYGNKISEVRGISNGNGQEIEQDYRDVAINFLENNLGFENADGWLEKEKRNERLNEYAKKIDEGSLKKEELDFLFKDLFLTDEFENHGKDNSNVVNLRSKLTNIADMMADYFECSVSEICFEDISFNSNKSITKNPYKVILGDARFSASNVTDLGNLEVIMGNANFSYSKIEDLKKLKFVGKDLFLSESKVIKADELKEIHGDADFDKSKIEVLDKLEYIGGNADFIESKIKSMKRLKHIGKNIKFKNGKIECLDSVEYIGGKADFTNTYITSLPRISNEHGEIKFGKEHDEVIEL